MICQLPSMALNVAAQLFHVWLFALSILFKFVLLVLLLILPSRMSKKLDIYATALPRDLKMFRTVANMTVDSYLHKMFNDTAYSEFLKNVRERPNKTCFVFGKLEWSFKMVDEYSSKVANVFKDKGYKKGDVIAIFMGNCPELIGLWLGLSRLGVIASLINFNLRGQSLKFSIIACKCQAIIFSNELAEVVFVSKKLFDSSVRYFQLSGSPKEGALSLESSLLQASESFNGTVSINYRDHLVYIYTSGTSGFPKAAIISHARFLLMGSFSSRMLGITLDDRVYNPLPMYHVAGGLLGVSMSLLAGSTGVIAPKFSASNYFADCIKYKCTVAMSVGEMCGYLLSKPLSFDDRAHYLRKVVTTGLRPSIWTRFTDRFGIDDIKEIYGATEGNIQFANTDNKVGVIGFVPKWLPTSLRRIVGVLVKVDQDTNEPLRDEKGFCVECDDDEIGILLGMIPKCMVTRTFDGYVDAKETEKKVIHNAFQIGDKAFVTGDLMTMDKYGYLYFKDRLGDNFRWKGENISSFEVETLISNVIAGHPCVVYGVEVEKMDGKAGMVAIVDPNRQVDLKELALSMVTNLPKYAIPRFIRLLPQLELTGSFRLKKAQLKKEGFDPNTLQDPLFFMQGNEFVPMSLEAYEDIMSGKLVI